MEFGSRRFKSHSDQIWQNLGTIHVMMYGSDLD